MSAPDPAPACWSLMTEDASASPPHAKWFTDEIRPHTPALRAYLRGAFPSVRDVDDVVQESFLRIWRSGMNRPIRFSKSFLFQVARRIAIDWVRRERVSPLVAVEDLNALPIADERPGIAEIASTRDELNLLVAALEAMPARLREVIVLRKIDGISQKEIALRLNLSELTVQVHVVRGLRRLEAYFQQHGSGRSAS